MKFLILGSEIWPLFVHIMLEYNVEPPYPRILFVHDIMCNSLIRGIEGYQTFCQQTRYVQ